ncbi:nitrogen regulation protein NR(II) [Candidatus Latescibacterota bacterium]
MLDNRTKMSASDWPVIRWMLIIRPAIVTATLGVAILIYPPDMINKPSLAIVVFGIYILTLLYWFAHKALKISRSVLGTAISFDIFIITVIIHYTNGYDSPFVGFYFLSIMCASLFFRKIITYLFATQAVIFYLLYVFVLRRFLVPSFEPGDVGLNVVYGTIIYCILFYGIGFFSSYFAEKLLGKDTALTGALKLLKEARLDTSDILQSMTNGLITIDMFGRIMYMNRVAEDILQVDRGVVGETYKTVFDERAQELVRIFDAQVESTSYVTEKEIEVHDKSGSCIPLGLTSMPLYDADVSLRGIIVNFKDLTEKKKLLEMLRQSERMAAIGELSAAIAHEIRNPLASISNAVEILSESLEKKDIQNTRLLDVLEKESDRLHRISTEFLQFARIKNPHTESVKLRNIINEVLILIDNDPKKTDEVVIYNNIDENAEVLFDADQLRQVVINIIINSLEAVDGHGQIKIEVEKHPPNLYKYVRVVFTDNGPGFPDGALGHMFEPFYSTKQHGTGLGLALVRKLVVGNNGRVFARNRDGGGAEVTLDLRTGGAE